MISLWVYMLSPADLITLPYTPDLTQAGVGYACCSLPLLMGHNSASLFSQMRLTVAAQAAELAFRRYLVKANIPHRLAGSGLFTGPDRYEVLIGGRLCEIHSSAVFRKNAIRKLRRDPSGFLQAPALVPGKDLYSEYLAGTDLLVFTFLTALVAPNLSEIKRASEAGQPLCMVLPMPGLWARPSCWRSLGNLALKHDWDEHFCVVLGGQAENRQFHAEEVNLPPLKRIQAYSVFYSLIYLQASRMPKGRLGVHSPGLEKTLIAQPHQWGNIWVYGMDVVLAGWITRQEYHQRACPKQSGQAFWQPTSQEARFMSVPASELRPMGDLFSKAKDWEIPHG